MSRSVPFDRWPQLILMAGALIALLFASQAKAEEAQTAATLFLPENAFNTVNEPEPSEARTMDRAEFETLVRSGQLTLALATRDRETNERQRASAASNLARAVELLRTQNPTLANSLLRLPPGLESSLSFSNAQGESQSAGTLGRDAASLELLNGLFQWDSRANHLVLYRALTNAYESAAAPNGSTDAFSPLRETSGAVDNPTELSLDELRILNTRLIASLEARVGRDSGRERAPSSYSKCALEEGSGPTLAEHNGDQTGRFCEAKPNGLLALSSWRLKFANTCVRNQGRRIAPGVFALTAALESLLADRRRRYANLSEQHLFAQARLRWMAKSSTFGDAPTPFADATFAEPLTNYRFHFEDIWLWNPATTRVESPETATYSGNCLNYTGRHCSESTHGAAMACAVVDGFRYCGYQAPMPAATPYRIAAQAVIFDPRQPDVGLAISRSLLRSGVPLIATFLVDTRFASAGANGYVPSEPVGPALGASTALVSGWVPNSQRPRGAPEAAGGGYFVIKNSWGTCAGDGGYYYLPYEWLKANALTLSAIF